MDKCLAIIPARGGSKGIHRKNLQEVGGKALIERTIRAAQSSRHISRVVVSTDDREIARVASRCEALVLERPAQLASDTTSSECALMHALIELGKSGDIEESFVFLQCTSPFTTSKDIDLVIESLHAYQCNSSFAVTPWHGFLWDKEGNGINHNPLLQRARRQDLAETYLETGSIYAVRTMSFMENKTRFCPPMHPVVVGHHPQEIDDLKDLELCRAIERLL